MTTIHNSVDEKRLPTASSGGTEQYDDYIRQLQKLPDFHRLPLPDSVRERLNIPCEYNYLSLTESVTRTFDNTYQYTNPNNPEIRDLTKETIEFPPIPEKHYLLEEIETITTCYGPTGTTTDETSFETPSQPPPTLDTPTEASDSMPQPSVDPSNSHPSQHVE